MTRAMILAAGRGERMRPLTDHTPKPLVHVAGRPLIAYALDRVQEAGIDEVVINASYLGDQVIAYARTIASLKIHTCFEPERLETGGGIANALPWLVKEQPDVPFFALNSDTIVLPATTAPLHRMQQAWNPERMDALLLLHPTQDAFGYDGKGDFFLSEEGTIQRRGHAESAPFVFTGTQLLHPRLFQDAPSGAFSMNILYDRDISRVYGLVHDGAWLHVGDVASIALAETVINNLSLG